MDTRLPKKEVTFYQALRIQWGMPQRTILQRTNATTNSFYR